MEYETFTDDKEKMKDFEYLTKEEFLNFYGYISEKEYDMTEKRYLINMYLSNTSFSNYSEYLCELDYGDNLEQIKDRLLECGMCCEEFAHYDLAMKYLMDNDDSLQDSIALADASDYRTRDLSSCLLASLHASNKLEQEFNSLWERISNDYSR